jgi:4-hydroxybenzoate polyprenyltransferase
MKQLLIAMRPKHWIKNLFLFLPLVFGEKLFSSPENYRVVIGFLIFSVTASAIYLLNDVLDMENDKLHSVKKLRPLAAGSVSPRTAVGTAVLLCALALFCGFKLDFYFGLSLVSYVVLNFLYMKYMKHVVILDVFCLGIFFVVRIIAGTALADVAFSHWMIFMVVLLAMFLGFNKRRQEFQQMGEDAVSHRSVLAKYNLYFIDQMISVLTSSLVIVYMLYTVDERTLRGFGTAHLYYSVPFVYYGIFRYLYLVHKRKTAEDPTFVLLSDGMMQLNLVLWAAICVGVIYFKI